jgi:RimJ/RimL family protein N-acetyltransferase
MNLQFEPLERSDFPKIRNWIDPVIFRLFKAPVDDKQLEMLLSKERDGVPAELGRRITDLDNGKLVGVIHAVLDPEDDLMHIRQIVVNPAHRGQGYGQAILKCFIDDCFANYDLHRIQLFTEENNESAIACYRKVGFKVDGILRDCVKNRNGYLNTHIFSILRDEWY